MVLRGASKNGLKDGPSENFDESKGGHAYIYIFRGACETLLALRGAREFFI